MEGTQRLCPSHRPRPTTHPCLSASRQSGNSKNLPSFVHDYILFFLFLDAWLRSASTFSGSRSGSSWAPLPTAPGCNDASGQHRQLRYIPGKRRQPTSKSVTQPRVHTVHYFLLTILFKLRTNYEIVAFCCLILLQTSVLFVVYPTLPTIIKKKEQKV